MSDGPRPGMILDDVNRINSAGLSAAFAVEWFGNKRRELMMGAAVVASMIRRRAALLQSFSIVILSSSFLKSSWQEGVVIASRALYRLYEAPADDEESEVVGCRPWHWRRTTSALIIETMSVW